MFVARHISVNGQQEQGQITTPGPEFPISLSLSRSQPPPNYYKLPNLSICTRFVALQTDIQRILLLHQLPPPQYASFSPPFYHNLSGFSPSFSPSTQKQPLIRLSRISLAGNWHELFEFFFFFLHTGDTSDKQLQFFSITETLLSMVCRFVPSLYLLVFHDLTS